ncbi:heat-inducible transcriptional repressor HrcA [Apilactobacillus xinyiensis]|uniref:Heat-inducible transcription repressor HrcA n=1 Tax=Apilactobacillus xinyiensis TaxID=2841032 RepID=A0ABT0HZN1_9LACO|nr:heat-inducible transcriptional repressor HrcA [Apilactobacillus xinyiensis]MCK8624035.1 heat-inducible transcriptional repressor HrcA [Apilactobacillus xinyiensis]
MLSDRQKMILRVIINDYTLSGVPVGSKVLSNQLPIHVSSATIRNEMAYLEKMGLINKTHSSSGRVPSNDGYRYYVDNLLASTPLTNDELLTIKKSLDGKFHKIDEIVKHSADILSNLTNYTALTLKPEKAMSSKLEGFRLVPLGNRQVMAIIVTDNQDIENQIFHIPDNVTGDQLEAVVKVINSKLVGKPIPIVISKLKNEIRQEISKYIKSPNGFLDTFYDVLSEVNRDKYYIGGQLNLLDFVDDTDFSYIKPLYALLNRNDDVSKMLSNPRDPISVKISPKTNDDLLRNYSVITGSYDVGPYGKGMIAILGPTRMPYSKIISIVNGFSDELSKKLLQYYNHYD